MLYCPTDNRYFDKRSIGITLLGMAVKPGQPPECLNADKPVYGWGAGHSFCAGFATVDNPHDGDYFMNHAKIGIYFNWFQIFWAPPALAPKPLLNSPWSSAHV